MEGTTHLLWQIAFWFSFILFVIPFPFKVFGYLNGSDKSHYLVKIDESIAVFFNWIGLIGFYSYVYGGEFFSQTFWYVWLVIMIAFSATAFLWSPKMIYAKEVLGQKRFTILYWVSLVLVLPMLYAVFDYAKTM